MTPLVLSAPGDSFYYFETQLFGSYTAFEYANSFAFRINDLESARISFAVKTGARTGNLELLHVDSEARKVLVTEINRDEKLLVFLSLPRDGLEEERVPARIELSIMENLSCRN